MKKLFTNTVLIKENLSKVQQVLMDGPQLMRWNPAISSLKNGTNNSFIIHRNDPAINSDEVLTIESKDQQVSYRSINGRLEYQLIFNLVEKVGSTLVTEDFYLLKDETLAIVFLQPIAKQAFNRNLNGLKRIIEINK
ncbi:hypothetical protein LCR01_00770 [Companilactobacillus crustorum]|nr:hypothetical protein [Companilactobacillus crustorum]WDT66189.1 hypothetical protein NV391_03000 [Companilactobacillus crustorum]GEO75634.1 hypothetical protein LCR01_00770 [Companilactobacillus crustorum]HCD07850.1 hypothetical protein [Lactobacillus sp.]